MTRLTLFFALISSAWLLSSCGGGTQAPPPTTPGGAITVAAAADLQFAFSEIGEAFEQETGHRATMVFGSTGHLTQQIENGAPFDLVASADRAYVDRLGAAGLILPDSVALYARGRIVLAVNRESGVAAADLPDLLSEQIRHIAIANPAHAPYGVAAQQALESAGLWEQVQGKLVYGENVRQALQYVQSGDAEAGIIALSVADVPEITWTLIEAGLHEPLDQALAVIASSRNPDLARQFAAYINGPVGRPVMMKYGFVLPGETILGGELETTPGPAGLP